MEYRKDRLDHPDPTLSLLSRDQLESSLELLEGAREEVVKMRKDFQEARLVKASTQQWEPSPRQDVSLYDN